jgi:hypothetical protein
VVVVVLQAYVERIYLVLFLAGLLEYDERNGEEQKNN